MPPIEDFMSRVVPWPATPQSDGWVNLHWRSPSPTDAKKSYWGGHPVKTIQEFFEQLQWAGKKKNIHDIYFCTSLQSQTGINTKGGLKVARSKALALSLKAIFLDLDVKDGPHGYATLPEALVAVQKFVQDARLPPPSAVVATGGGIHVYWFSNKPLTQSEWQLYANGLRALTDKYGLRCDGSVTIDAARILRVPGTFNYKQQPLRPVRILGLRPKELDYDFATSLSFLAALVPVAAGLAGPAFLEGEPIHPAAFAILPKESLSEGIYEDTPLDPLPIMKGCAFLRDALLTGGKDYTQPMWNLTTLAATFLEDGHVLAHKMGISIRILP